jgi:hypothetical protein
VVSDQSRRLYNSFGLRSRPLHRLFDRETMKTYAHELCADTCLPGPVRISVSLAVTWC